MIFWAIAALVVGGAYYSWREGLINLGAEREYTRIENANTAAQADRTEQSNEMGETAEENHAEIRECENERCVVDGVDGIFK